MNKSKIKNGNAYARAYRARVVAEGLCPNCGQEKRDFNRRTGKPYKYGPNCRAINNAYQKALMRRRRQGD